MKYRHKKETTLCPFWVLSELPFFFQQRSSQQRGSRAHTKRTPHHQYCCSYARRKSCLFECVFVCLCWRSSHCFCSHVDIHWIYYIILLDLLLERCFPIINKVWLQHQYHQTREEFPLFLIVFLLLTPSSLNSQETRSLRSIDCDLHQYQHVQGVLRSSSALVSGSCSH